MPGEAVIQARFLHRSHVLRACERTLQFPAERDYQFVAIVHAPPLLGRSMRDYADVRPEVFYGPANSG